MRLMAAEGLARLSDPELGRAIPHLVERESRFALRRRLRWRKLRAALTA
jgi:hypothetical protein